MASPKPLILRLVASCVHLANESGKVIRDVMKKGELNIVDKGVKDYQTEADRRVNQLVISSLSRQFPKISIIGEEGTEDSSAVLNDEYSKVDESILSEICPENLADVVDDQITVWVDPLDGTTEYTQGFLEHVTVLIGVAVGTQAVAGVIHQPYYKYKERDDCGRTIWGILGLGVRGHYPQELPKDRLILTTTRSHLDAVVQETINSLEPDEVLKVGGAGHKVLLLLEGKAHAYIFASPGCKRWDTCAPEAILHAAGGWLTDMNGATYSYNKETNVVNKGGILASANKVDHSKFLNAIPNHVKLHFKN